MISYPVVTTIKSRRLALKLADQLNGSAYHSPNRSDDQYKNHGYDIVIRVDQYTRSVLAGSDQT